MKIKLTLSDCEVQTLRQLSLNHHWRDARTRAAGLLELNAGAHPTQIGERLGVSHQSIYNWRNAWRKHGLTGLISGHAGGRPTVLSPALIQTAVTVATQEALTLKGISQRVQEIEGGSIDYSLVTLGRALKASGLTFKRTRWSLKKSEMRNSLTPVKSNSPV
jgi:transposase